MTNLLKRDIIPLFIFNSIDQGTRFLVCSGSVSKNLGIPICGTIILGIVVMCVQAASANGKMAYNDIYSLAAKDICQMGLNGICGEAVADSQDMELCRRISDCYSSGVQDKEP